MKQQDLRTYQRRGVTRQSGFHTCEETTGGECLVKRAQAYRTQDPTTSFVFRTNNIELVELFDSGNGLLVFGGYIYTNKPIRISFKMTYRIGKHHFEHQREFTEPMDINGWTNIGFHKEVKIEYESDIESPITVYFVIVEMLVTCDPDTILEFISFDVGAITKPEFIGDALKVSFNQKTTMHIPYLYYLDGDKPLEATLLYAGKALKSGTTLDDASISPSIALKQGRIVVLKSCNRCGRFLPINISNELNTLSYSLHCKKRAPCVHSTFRAYTIQNASELNDDDKNELKIENGKVVTYYGHQLECKACKKFFVNAPLNPQRNPQQFKEDGLRRRAIEVLVNNLLERNLVHFEFESRTKKEFSEYIWNKFDCKCFKCGKELPLDEMHLDHTMPLAYLYRLDETATCLCGTHNAQKSDHFPVEYYTSDELVKLSKITGLPMDLLTYQGINQTVLNLLIDKIVWFYDSFLMETDYQKIRDGILTADKINDSLKRVISGKADLAEEYRRCTGRYPSSVTIG